MRIASAGLVSIGGWAIYLDMSPVENALLTVLIELDEAVRSMGKTEPKPSLMPLFERIDRLAAELPRTTDPTLLHYLHKRSYEKARLHLQGRDAENQQGNCHRV